MKKLSAFTVITSMLALTVALAACEKDGSKDPAPPAPAQTPAASATTPPASNDTPVEDAGRRDLSDGGYYPGKSTKPM